MILTKYVHAHHMELAGTSHLRSDGKPANGPPRLITGHYHSLCCAWASQSKERLIIVTMAALVCGLVHWLQRRCSARAEICKRPSIF
jgi:hypothetical protein